MWGTERRVFILIFKVVALKLGVLLGVWWPEWGKERGGLAQTETEGGGHGVVWPQSGGGSSARREGAQATAAGGGGLGAERGHGQGMAGWGTQPGEGAEGLWEEGLGAGRWAGRKLMGVWVGWASFPSTPVYFYVCLDVCFSSAELKRGISQDLTSSPKLDRYKIARQLTEKAIKVNAFWGLGHF